MSRTIIACALACLLSRDGQAQRPLPDYRYFRAVTIDLLGRPPTLDELAQLERPGFTIDAWIDAHLEGPRYAERLRRVYMDLLRLESSPTTIFAAPAATLRPKTIEGPHGPIDVYYRAGQRRRDPALDGAFCFTEAETGLTIMPDRAPIGQAHAITQQLLDARTIEIKPWWLYADYRAVSPRDRASETWAQRFPGFELLLGLFVDPDKAPTASVRVCREEAQEAPVGRIMTTGRVFHPGMKPPAGRPDFPPFDSTYATTHAGERIECTSATAFQSSWECGCGKGLERCIPFSPSGFKVAIEDPLGIDQPFMTLSRSAAVWVVEWWAEEAKHFMDDIFANDRDVRELLASRATVINGPLAQFYRFLANDTCCGAGNELGYGNPDPLFDPHRVPPDLIPEDTTKWTRVADRGEHAAGLMTMPIFLMKYGTRRARAHVLYNAFLCRDFVAEQVALPPSNEADLTKRPGCAACHVTLEPLAAYFSRVQENDWTYLPASSFPVSSDHCAGTKLKKPHGCNVYYDPAFATATTSSLRGSYSSPANADSGPAGLARALTQSPEFPRCVARNVAQSFLGRALTSDDDSWLDVLSRELVNHGYRMRPLVKAILTSPQYRDVNDRKPRVQP